MRQDFHLLACVTNSMCAYLVSVMNTVENGTGWATIVATPPSKSQGIALMVRTEAEKASCPAISALRQKLVHRMFTNPGCQVSIKMPLPDAYPAGLRHCWAQKKRPVNRLGVFGLIA